MESRKSVLPRFAVTIGDPCGIGPEVTLKSIEKLPKHIVSRLVVIGDRSSLEKGNRFLRKPLLYHPFESEKLPPTGKVSAIFVDGSIGRMKPGTISSAGGKASAKYIEKAVEMCMNGTLSGIVTAPISKEALSLAGIKYPGHTEMLAKLSGSTNIAMMLASPTMKVALLTTHLSVAKAVKKVKKEAVFLKIKLLYEHLRPKKPIAVCGLNPHASDGGIFGNEEQLEILPAVKNGVKLGINVVGPLPADTLFAPQIRDRYSVILAMYHDQGLVAIKAVSFGNCTNVTLGLPFIRTSVDHGTAFDIAGRGIADPSSMVYAIKTAFRLDGGEF